MDPGRPGLRDIQVEVVQGVLLGLVLAVIIYAVQGLGKLALIPGHGLGRGGGHVVAIFGLHRPLDTVRAHLKEPSAALSHRQDFVTETGEEADVSAIA